MINTNQYPQFIPSPLGANVTFRFKDDDENQSPLRQSYISFGEYDESTHADTFGFDDDQILFYCENGELELKSLMTDHGPADFIVIDYTLVFPS